MKLQTSIKPRRDGIVNVTTATGARYVFRLERGELTCEVADTTDVAFLLGLGDFFPADSADNREALALIAGSTDPDGDEPDDDPGDPDAPPIEANTPPVTGGSAPTAPEAPAPAPVDPVPAPAAAPAPDAGELPDALKAAPIEANTPPVVSKPERAGKRAK